MMTLWHITVAHEKTQKYSMNYLPFRLTDDPMFLQSFLVLLENFPLYDSLNYCINALAFISLYHESKQNNNKDKFLSLDPDVYLALSDYHTQRSIQALSLDINMEVTYRRVCCLCYTAAYQILLSIFLPTQKIASRAFLMLYKNLEFIEDSFGNISGNCKIYKHTQIRRASKFYSKSSMDFFPEFLYDLLTVEYPPEAETNSTKILVGALNNKDKELLQSMIDKLKINYRIYQNSTKDEMPELDEDGYPVMDSDLLIATERLFYGIPEEFIELVATGEPRSLIIVGYSILLLSSKMNLILSKNHYRGEVIFILNKLDRCQNSKYWSAWLDPVMTALSN